MLHYFPAANVVHNDVRSSASIYCPWYTRVYETCFPDIQGVSVRLYIVLSGQKYPTKAFRLKYVKKEVHTFLQMTYRRLEMHLPKVYHGMMTNNGDFRVTVLMSSKLVVF